MSRPALTDAEIKLLCAIARHMTITPEGDWQLVSTDLGHTNVMGTRARWRELKRKLNAGEENKDAAAAFTPKSTPTKRTNNEAGFEENGTPSKKGRKVKKVDAAEEVDGVLTAKVEEDD